MAIANEEELLSLITTTFPPAQNVLVIAPHPDDEVFGCGATLSLLQSGGSRITTIIVTNGALGGDNADRKLIELRAEESRAAARLLGFNTPIFWGLPDRGVSYGEVLIGRLIETIRDTDADLVFLPSPTDWHPDHQAIAFAGAEAVRRVGGQRQAAFYEVTDPLPYPNLIHDIGATEEKKRQAMRCFPSQLQEQPYDARISGINSFRAMHLGAQVKSAEAFMVLTATDLGKRLSILLDGPMAHRRSFGFATSGCDIPLVSVIIRSMDRPTLTDALDSLALQTYSNIEVVLVNAKGSGHQPVEPWCGRFPVRVVDTGERLPRSRAANMGLDAAQGEYLIFLDDDDWFDADHIQKLVAALRQHPELKVVYTGVRSIDERDNPLPNTFSFPFDSIRLLAVNFIPIHAILFSRTLLELGCRIDESFEIYEDWDFWIQLSRFSDFLFVDGVSATYRINQQAGSGVHLNGSITETAKLVILRKWHDALSDDQVIKIMQAVQQSPIKDGQISNLHRAVAERDGRLASLNHCVAESNQRLMHLEHEISERNGIVQAQAQTIAELQNSSSWRVTRPLRYVGRLWRKAQDVKNGAQRLLQRESLPELSKRLLRVLRQEGVKGVKVRIRQQYYLATQVTSASPPVLSPTKLGFQLEPAAIVRDRQGHYALASRPGGYTYIEPQRPANLNSRLARLQSLPSFSIVVPVYNTPIELLDALLASVQAQWYPHWQLVLADDASPAEEIRKALARIDHPQIKVLFLEKNQGIAGATNVAIEAASGDFIVFMDHDDELTVDCLYELALCIEREQPDFVYSDEDKITEFGDYSEPHFKPDWSPDTMMSTMFTCHVSCIRRSLLDTVGGLRSQYDGCQDWDFVLRVSEQTDRISHVPKVLYHWRIIPGSIASDISAKSYILDASKRVREDALARRGLVATVEPIEQISGYFRVAYQLQGNPLISIIIPTRDNVKILRRCIDSILQTTGYRHFELVILDNGSVDPASVAYLQQINGKDGVKVIRHDAPFNFSELNNIGARTSTGELLLFLNDDTEVLQRDWLERLGGFAQLAHVGAVGAKLLYPGRKQVQHAGVLNLEGGPGHAFLMQDCDAPGYCMRNLLEYNWLAVTGACLMVSRDKFDAIGGFCETLPIAYNDIDLCMRLHDAGFYNVVCQAVRLTHHESASRGLDNTDPKKAARLRRDLVQLYERNPGYFQHDPFHNPNLRPNGINFEVPA